MNQETYEQLAGRTMAAADAPLARLRTKLYLLGFLAELRNKTTVVEQMSDHLKREIFYDQSRGLRDLLPNLPPGMNNFKLKELSKSLDLLEVDLLHSALGVLSEAGEYFSQIASAIFNSVSVDVTNLKEEIGDHQWYFAIPARLFDFTIRECQELNIAKLKKRYGDKFSQEGAVQRDLAQERAVLEGQEALGELVHDANQSGPNEEVAAAERKLAAALETGNQALNQIVACRALLEAAGFSSIDSEKHESLLLADQLSLALAELKTMRDAKEIVDEMNARQKRRKEAASTGVHPPKVGEADLYETDAAHDPKPYPPCPKIIPPGAVQEVASS